MKLLNYIMIFFKVFSFFKDKLIGAPHLFVEFRAQKNREKKKKKEKKKREENSHRVCTH